MRKLLILFMALVHLLIACTEKPEPTPEPGTGPGTGTEPTPEPVPVNVVIAVTTSDVALSEAFVADLQFEVTPADFEFDYTVGVPECQISLKVVETAEGQCDAAEPVNYKMTQVLKNEEGKYTAKIKDSGKSASYSDKAILSLQYNDNDGKSVTVNSEPFALRMTGTDMISMTFTKEANQTGVFEDFVLDYKDGVFSVKSPLISSSDLVMSYETTGYKVYVNGVEQVSGETVNDFSSPVTYKVVSADGTEKEYVVNVTYSGLPVLFINTPGGAEVPDKHSDWLSGTEIVLYNSDWTVDYEGTTGMRGRGNSTWHYPKKPYAFKLDSKAEILGMPKHKRWVLLANWMDRTLLRNRISFAIAMKTGLAWTPHGEFVEVFLNGEFLGNYYLCEHIKIDKNRVNIDELEDDDVDSGYIFELDSYFDEDYKFRSQYYNMPYMFKDPDEVNEDQFAFMQDYVNNMEASLYINSRFADREYTEYLNVDSFIDWWLVHEITGNAEPKHPKSSYMHRNTGGKLTMGPVWDFDWETFKPHKNYIIKDKMYYGRLFQDAKFRERVKERWSALEAGFREIPAYIESEAARIKSSESMNHEMWPITPEGGQGLVNGDETLTFDDAVQRMIKAYEDKLEWLDQNIANL